MKLIPLSLQHIESQPSLPFDLYDARGRLLWAAHKPLDQGSVRAHLRARNDLHADAHAVEDWLRSLADAVGRLVRGRAPLSPIAAARPRPARPPVEPARPGEEWEALAQGLDAALRQAGPDGPWLQRVLDVQARARALGAQRLDEALLHFIYQGARHADQYSSHQALRCMLIAGATARELRWDDALAAAVERAALTMNVAMRRLQDRLALDPAAVLDAHTRREIARHPEDGARLLHAGGVADTLWLEAVRLHHDDGLEAQPLQRLDPGQRAALLLRRVDVYGAGLSRRAARPAQTAPQAARKACVGPDGRPDAIGAALLRSVGLYPPGSFVELDSCEQGVVLSRGTRINQPLAAALLDAQGLALAEPRLRDTAQPAYGVRAALRASEVPVLLPATRLIALQARGAALRGVGGAGR